jgi:GAF domain-containing protein
MVDADLPMQPHDAFNELGRVTLADNDLASVMEKIAALTQRTTPGADSVSVTLVEGGRASTVAFTGPLALELDERQYDRGYGPCLDCIAGGEPVRIRDMGEDSRWPDYAQEAQRRGVGSSLSIPVPLQREVSAALNIYSTQKQAFGDADLEVAATFAAYAGVALANMHLYQAQSRLAEDLQSAMRSRATIEQAKGILMGARRCTADEAFTLMVGMSQDSNRKLRDVAQAIVDTASAG